MRRFGNDFHFNHCRTASFVTKTMLFTVTHTLCCIHFVVLFLFFVFSITNAIFAMFCSSSTWILTYFCVIIHIARQYSKLRYLAEGSALSAITVKPTSCLIQHITIRLILYKGLCWFRRMKWGRGVVSSLKRTTRMTGMPNWAHKGSLIYVIPVIFDGQHGKE